MLGGHSDIKQCADNAEERELFLSAELREQHQAKAGTVYEHYDAICYTQQVVAGMIYWVKFKVGENAYNHVEILQPLPHTGKPAEIRTVQQGKSLDDPFDN